MNRIFLLSLAVLAPALVSGITEAEVAAAGRAYFAPMSSASFWRMRMPDGLIREFELRESGGRYTFKSVDGWTGSVQEGNAVLITTPKNVKPKVEWGFVNGTLHMIAEDGILGQARRLAKKGAYTGTSTTDRSYMTFANYSRLPITTDFTFSGWINSTGPPKGAVGRIASRNYYISGGNYAPDWELMVSDYTTLKVFAGSATPVTGTIPSAQDTWVHIAGVFKILYKIKRK